MATKPEKFGRYYLLDKLAASRMAEIFKAKIFGPGGFEKLLVIKRILPQYAESAEFVEIFTNEARVVVTFNHPNIVPVFDCGRILGHFFIAMEYVNGKDLGRLIKSCRERGHELGIEFACFIATEALKGLSYAHQQRDDNGESMDIVHRDISPANLLISYDGDVKLTDFGIAEAIFSAGKTDAAVLKGKFSYMAPEQTRGEALDPRSDVFSLGIVLWEQLTLQRLFHDENDLIVLKKIRNADYPPPSAINPNVPTELDRIVMTALHPEPAKRYQRASDFNTALTDFLLANKLKPSSRKLSVLMKLTFEEEIHDELEQQDVENYYPSLLDDMISAEIEDMTKTGFHLHEASGQTNWSKTDTLREIEELKRIQADRIQDIRPDDETLLSAASDAPRLLSVVESIDDDDYRPEATPTSLPPFIHSPPRRYKPFLLALTVLLLIPLCWTYRGEIIATGSPVVRFAARAARKSRPYLQRAWIFTLEQAQKLSERIDTLKKREPEPPPSIVGSAEPNRAPPPAENEATTVPNANPQLEGSASPSSQPVSAPPPSTTPPPVVVQPTPPSISRPVSKASTKSAAARRATRRSGFGTLEVQAIPWAEVYLQGQLISSETPLLDYRIRAGKHLLTLRHPPSGIERKIVIVVEKDQRLGVSVRMASGESRIDVN